MIRATLAVLGVVIAACSGAKTCACPTGCCNAELECQPGTTVAACGNTSGLCSACPSGERCHAGGCVPLPDAGPMGGGAGGSGGSGGGGVPRFSCSSTRTVASVTGPIVDAGYAAFNWVAIAAPPDLLVLELYAALATVPGEAVLDGGSYQRCGVCPLYFEGCDGGGCERTYLGIGGSVQVLEATQARPGRLRAQLSNVVLAEWDFAADVAADGGRCVLVQAASIDAGW